MPLSRQTLRNLRRKLAAHQEGKLKDDSFEEICAQYGLTPNHKKKVFNVLVRVPGGHLSARQLESVAQIAEAFTPDTNEPARCMPDGFSLGRFVPPSGLTHAPGGPGCHGVGG